MPRLLIIDDEPDLRTLYRTSLEAEGYQVETASSPTQAMAILAKGGVDLIVLDIQLGDENGLDLLNTIAQRDRNLPVIICTAYSCYQDDLSSWQANAYVVKSSDLTPLKQEIRRFLT